MAAGTKPSSLPTKSARVAASSTTSKKKSASAAAVDVASAIGAVRTLERGIYMSAANINNLVALARHAAPGQPHRAIHASLHAQHRAFKHYAEAGAMRKALLAPDHTDAVARETCSWLRKQHAMYLARVAEVVAGAIDLPSKRETSDDDDDDEEEDRNSDPALQLAALQLMLQSTHSASADLRATSEHNVFDNVFYLRLVNAAFIGVAPDAPGTTAAAARPQPAGDWHPVFARDALAALVSKPDTRYYLFKALAKLIDEKLEAARTAEEHAATATPTPAEVASSSAPSARKRKRVMAAPTAEQSADRAVAALVRLAHTAFHVLGVAAAHPVTDASLAEATYFVGGEVPATHLLRQAVAHKRAFSEFVLAYVRLPLTPVLYKRVLMVVQAQIMPHMTDARLLMGFLNESYQRGGSVGVLALHGLFTLIVRHNLDYPDFYTKLYALFDRDLLHVKYRSRFLRLFVIFMQSTHIPAYLVAAFLKRLARLCLHAPPAAVLAALPIMYNLIKRHPATFVLIHRDGLDASAAAREDVFDMDATDPAKARALESSLWELTALQRHYFPNVATLAKVFSEKMTKPGWEVEEFLDYTYGNLFDTVHVAALKKAPALNHAPPISLLTPADRDGFMSLFEVLPQPLVQEASSA